MDNEIVRAVEATIKLGAGIAIDGYMVPNGTVRYGLKYTSELLGYSSNYFLRLTKDNPKKLKALEGKGYTGYIVKARLSRQGKRGASYAYTINLEDFSVLVEYEAIEEKNPKAIGLLSSSFRELLRSRSLEAFGLPDDSLEYKLEAFSETFLERQQCYADDRQDLEDLWLPGDTLYYEQVVDWEDYKELLDIWFDMADYAND